MNPAIAKLQALLTDLQGQDMALMNPESESAFRRNVTERFKEATSTLHQLLLGEHAGDARWLWQAGEAESFGGEWIATYSLVATDQMESAIGKHEKIQMAAAMFPGLSLTVDAFAEYHHPGGTGLQVTPNIQVAANVAGDPELALVETFLELARQHFPVNCKGISVEVFPTENCCDEIRNPSDIGKAFSQVAKAARKVGLQEYGTTSVTERVRLILEFDGSGGLAEMQEAIELMGRLFVSVALVIR